MIKETIKGRTFLVGITLVASILLRLSSVSAAEAPAPYMSASRYNLAHQVTGTILPSADGTSLYPAVRHNYDARKGLLISTEEGVLNNWQDEMVAPQDWSGFAVARKTVFTYDELGRKATESLVGMDGNAVSLTQYGYDGSDRVQCKAIRMNPAAFGNLPAACSLGPEGMAGPDRVTRYDYLIQNLVTFEKRGVGTSLQQTYVENRYKLSTCTTSNCYLLIDQIDANGNLTHYEYDARARLKRTYFPQKIASSPATYNTADYEEYGYDLNHNRTTLRKRDGRTITYNYDGLNRVWRRDLATESGTTTSVYQGYDLLGRQRYARFNSDTGPGVTVAYNGFGEPMAETTNTNGTSYTLSYQYDLNGNRTRIIHPDNASFSYRYDQLDRLSDIYEGGNAGAVLIHYSYDALARPKSLTTGGATTSTSSYDAASRPQTLTFDPAGSTYDVSYAFAFNPAGQIVTRDLSNSNFQYREKGSAAGSYVANGLNQYTQVGGAVFAYDANGNLKSDGATTYTYDIENHLTGASGARNAVLKYDPLGHLYQIIGNTSTNFVYSGDSLVAEYQNGIMTKRYVFGAGLDKPLVSYSGSAVSAQERQFIHGNYQGSAIAITDGAGNIVSTNSYDPYGVPSVNNKGRFGYTGQTFMPELGMYYYKARFYYPQIGRYLQTDPIGYKDDMGWYSYVGNDPINGVDPGGHQVMRLFVLPPASPAMASRSLQEPDLPRGPPPSAQTPGLTYIYVYLAVKFFGPTIALLKDDTNSATGSPPPPDDDKDKDLSKEDRKSIRSLEKQIEKHEQKLADFKNNPSVRPGMENQSQEVIEAQRATRIRHLETEIRTFQNNIDKIRGGL